MNWDAIVVGGGPAGSGFAFAAAATGRKVVVLEKDAVPSSKVCGGVLSPRCLRAFERLGLKSHVDAVPFQRLNHLAVELAKGGKLMIPFPEGADARVVDRTALDGMLWQAAAGAGATMYDRSQVTHIDSTQRNWRIEARRGTQDRENFIGDFLVGADGRNSFVARQLGVPMRTTHGNGKSLCYQYRLRKHEFDRQGVHFFIFPEGYCGLSVDGTGCAHLDVISLRGSEKEAELMARLRGQDSLFVERLGRADFAPGKPITRTPIGSGQRPPPTRTDLALLGDAQGWVEPFTGEGISLALESAHITFKNLSLGKKSTYRHPTPSITNRCVAEAIEKPWLAHAMVRFLQCCPPGARWMASEVLR